MIWLRIIFWLFTKCRWAAGWWGLVFHQLCIQTTRGRLVEETLPWTPTKLWASREKMGTGRQPCCLEGLSAWQGELVTQTPHPEAEKAHRKHLTRFRRKQRPQIRHGKSWFIVLSIGLDLRWDHSDSLVLKLINIACDVGSTRRDRWVLGCCIPSTEGWMIYSRRWSNCDLGETPH